MKIETAKALRISWKTATQIAEDEISKILGRKIKCDAHMDDDAYWTISFPEERLPMSDLYKILEAIEATPEQRLDSIPPESERMTSVNCLGMDASSLLLSRYFGYLAEHEFLEPTSLWLLGEKTEVRDGTQN